MVWIGMALLALKWAGLSVVAGWSWWWIALPFGLAFVWFELDERLGFAKKREIDDVDKARRARIQHGLDRKINLRARK